jgi:hypothetical protein
VIGDVQPPQDTNSHRRLFTMDLDTGSYASWPAGLRDDEGITQIVASADGRRALVSVTGITGARAGYNRIEIFDLASHRDVGELALPPGTSNFVDGLSAAITPNARIAYCAVGRSRIGVDERGHRRVRADPNGCLRPR